MSFIEGLLIGLALFVGYVAGHTITSLLNRPLIGDDYTIRNRIKAKKGGSNKVSQRNSPGEVIPVQKGLRKIFSKFGNKLKTK